jgi:hypothetical protein
MSLQPSVEDDAVQVRGDGFGILHLHRVPVVVINGKICRWAVDVHPRDAEAGFGVGAPSSLGGGFKV